MFVMDNSGTFRDCTRTGHPTLAGPGDLHQRRPRRRRRRVHQAQRPDGRRSPTSSRWSRRATSPARGPTPTRSRRGRTTRRARDAAFASGVHVGEHRLRGARPGAGVFGSPYFVQIPGGTPARCNPINAPTWCTSPMIESLARRLTASVGDRLVWSRRRARVVASGVPDESLDDRLAALVGQPVGPSGPSRRTRPGQPADDPALGGRVRGREPGVRRSRRRGRVALRRDRGAAADAADLDDADAEDHRAPRARRLAGRGRGRRGAARCSTRPATSGRSPPTPSSRSSATCGSATRCRPRRVVESVSPEKQTRHRPRPLPHLGHHLPRRRAARRVGTQTFRILKFKPEGPRGEHRRCPSGSARRSRPTRSSSGTACASGGC